MTKLEDENVILREKMHILQAAAADVTGSNELNVVMTKPTESDDVSDQLKRIQKKNNDLNK